MPFTLPGKVYLVGAGPGSAKLLTLRALEILRTADLVLHDDLVSDDVLAAVPANRLDGSHRNFRRMKIAIELRLLFSSQAFSDSPRRPLLKPQNRQTLAPAPE